MMTESSNEGTVTHRVPAYTLILMLFSKGRFFQKFDVLLTTLWFNQHDCMLQMNRGCILDAQNAR